MNTNISPKALGLILLPIVTACFWVACIAYDFEMLHGAVGMTCLCIVTMPMLMQAETHWFSPWTFVILSVTLGCAARGICMSFAWPDPHDIDYYFLLGEDAAFFVRPYFYLLLGMVCLSLGYFAYKHPRTKPSHFVRSLRWNVPRMNFILAVVVMVAALSTLQYIRNTGGFTSSVISGKRTVIHDIDIQGDADFNQYGYLRQMAKLGTFAYLTFLGYTLFYVKRISAVRMAILGCMLILACVFPFYSSSRLPIMWIFVGSAALLWYSGREIQIQKLAIIGAVGFVVFFGMTSIRGKSDVTERFKSKTFAVSLADSMVIHRNFMGIAKTAHVIAAIPSQLSHEYGKTIAVWAVSPIPRRIWSNKPMVHAGPMVGYRVYGNNVSGVPPGMIGELFWNFHIVGVVIGSFFLGMLLRWVGEYFRPRPGRDLPMVLIYVIGPMRLGFEISGNSVGFGLMKVAMDTASMCLVLMLVLDRQHVVSSIRKRVTSTAPMRRAA